MSSQSQKSQALLSLWGHLVLTSIAKQTHTHTHTQINHEHDSKRLMVLKKSHTYCSRSKITALKMNEWETNSI